MGSTVHGVAKSQTRLSNFTYLLYSLKHFHISDFIQSSQLSSKPHFTGEKTDSQEFFPNSNPHDFRNGIWTQILSFQGSTFVFTCTCFFIFKMGTMTPGNGFSFTTQKFNDNYMTGKIKWHAWWKYFGCCIKIKTKHPYTKVGW